MIYDKLINCEQYLNAHPLFGLAFDFLRKYKGAETGTYQLGSGVYAMVQSYNTKAEEDCKWETHRKYIDLQFIFSGREKFGIANIEAMKLLIEYNPVKDVSFYTGEGSYLNMNDSEFAILFPSDAHKMQIGGGQHVDKIVIKIPYGENK